MYIFILSHTSDSNSDLDTDSSENEGIWDSSDEERIEMSKKVIDLHPKIMKKAENKLDKLKNKKTRLEIKIRKEIEHELDILEGKDDLLPTCEICLEKYDQCLHWESCIIKCGHKFGQSSIEKQLETNNRCPKCNKKFQKTDIITLF